MTLIKQYKQNKCNDKDCRAWIVLYETCALKDYKSMYDKIILL